MSHQSLEDLVNVTGTPADNKILKYSSGSWSPSDESGGGGSSGAEYLEIFQIGDSEDMGGMLLNTSGTYTEIIHNSIPTTSVCKRADATGIGFNHFSHSDYDDVFWALHHASAKYLVEVDMLINYDSSSTSAQFFQYGIAQSGHGVPSVTVLANVPNSSVDSTYLVSTQWNQYFMGATGKIQRVCGRWWFSPSSASSTYASTPCVDIGRDEFTYAYFPKGANWTNNNPNLSILRRHVRLTKIA